MVFTYVRRLRPMFFLRKPSATKLDELIARHRTTRLSYTAVLATQGKTPPGYTFDHNRICLGSREQTWERACAGLRDWVMFDLGWTEAWPPGAPIDVGTPIAMIARHFGFYSVNISRIVYLVGEADRFGFAYGTTFAHVESGEERFLIERFPDGSVWYDLLAFSRPRHPLVRLGSSVARILQKRFVRDSLRRVRDAVEG